MLSWPSGFLMRLREVRKIAQEGMARLQYQEGISPHEVNGLCKAVCSSSGCFSLNRYGSATQQVGFSTSRGQLRIALLRFLRNGVQDKSPSVRENRYPDTVSGSFQIR